MTLHLTAKYVSYYEGSINHQTLRDVCLQYLKRQGFRLEQVQ